MAGWERTDLQRSYKCNAELVAFLRKKRGYTQAQLALASGFSERLISKVEAGNSVARQSVAKLAETLSADSEPIYPEDLISDPLAMAKEYVEALYTHSGGFLDSIRHFVHDDIEFHIAGDPNVFPFAGTHRGIEALERAFLLFFSILQVPENHDHKECYTFIGEGNEVIIWGESWIHPIGKPLDKPVKLTHLMRFERGKLIFCEDRFDTMEGARVLKDEKPPESPENSSD